MNDPATVTRRPPRAASGAGKKARGQPVARTSIRAGHRRGWRRRRPAGRETTCRRWRRRGRCACSRVATTCPAAKNGDHTIAGPIVHADSRVAGPRRLEQVGLVAEAEHPVVVHEVDVPVEGQRSQVGEVVEPVALEPRAELQAAGPGRGEAAPRGSAPRRAVPCRIAIADDGRSHRHDDHRRERRRVPDDGRQQRSPRASRVRRDRARRSRGSPRRRGGPHVALSASPSE